MTRNNRLLLRLPIAAAAIAAILLVVHYRTRSGAETGTAHAASPKDAPAAGGARVVPVLTAPVEQRDVPVWLEGLGTAAAYQQVTVRPQVEGRLDAVLFTEGQAVKRGQVLA